MRSTIVLLTALCIASLAVAEEPAGVPAPRKECCSIDPAACTEPGIVLACMGGKDVDFCKRLSNYVQESFSCPTRLARGPEGIEALPRAEQAEKLAALMGKKDVGVLAWCDQPEETAFKDELFKESRIGMVNVATVETIEKEGVSADEQHARMVERACVREVGLLIGLQDCPWPRCAMHVVPEESPHNIRGRNLCPPCHGKAMKLLNEKGIVPLIERPIPQP